MKRWDWAGNEAIHQLIINNLTFHGMQDISGTALELIHTNAKIINSLFLFNYGSYRGPIGLLEFLILRHRIPPQSLYALVGGALIVNCSNISVTGSRFEGNIAELGGAIFSEGSSNIALINCSLTNNNPFSSRNLCFGGAIFTENGWYNLNVSITAFTCTSINLINTKFSNNRAISLLAEEL